MVMNNNRLIMNAHPAVVIVLKVFRVNKGKSLWEKSLVAEIMKLLLEVCFSIFSVGLGMFVNYVTLK